MSVRGRIARTVGIATVAIVAAGVVADRVLARIRRSPVVPIDTRVEIAAPLDVVWAVLSDIPRQPEWMRDMRSVRILTPGPMRRGTRAEAIVRIFGIAVADPVTVTTWQPPTTFGVRHHGAFRGSGRLTLAPGTAGASTVVHWREVLVPPVLPFIGSLVQWPILRWVFQNDLYRLRTLIEDR